MDTKSTSQNCCGSNSSNSTTEPQIDRRNFLKASVVGAATLMASPNSVMAGPFRTQDFDQLIPANKKLSETWIKSLYARGEPLTAASGQREYIGMPIGGIATGQVYLSADGQLWNWNLKAKKGKKHNPKGFSFMLPDIANPPVEEGFALKVKDKVWTLNATGFGHVKFTNQYPIGVVDYADEQCPISVQLEAYSPFIPLNRDKSSYPVVVMKYALTNATTEQQTVDIAGWIHNNKNDKKLPKVNIFKQFDQMAAVECGSNEPQGNSMALGLLSPSDADFADIKKTTADVESIFFQKSSLVNNEKLELGPDQATHAKLFASIGRTLTILPGETKVVSFLVSWRVPTIQYGTGFGYKTSKGRNHYATTFNSAIAASLEVAQHKDELYATTKAWVKTWYDSTLPYWLLERAIIPLNAMQTQVAQRIYPEGSDVDIYNLEEGVRCCPGNCTHVWNYAQGLARIFPEIERECREKIEYGLGFDDTNGMVYFRYNIQENKDKKDAVDGTCGTIIRVLRESQMTSDLQFLRRLWPRVKLSMENVIRHWDKDESGMLSGAQHNTLDEPWFGKVHWLINVYHAALKASAVMANQMGQPEVALRYEVIAKKGAVAMVDTLWNEDFGYFVHIPGVKDSEKHGSTNGCHIDQVLGDSWLYELGLDPVLPLDKTKRALQSLWQYNFTPNVGAYRNIMTEGRFYASEGDAGLVMCTFPNGKIEPKSGKKAYAGYLNECMSGFEWQVAAHMLRVGMVQEGLAVGKAIYDRYQPQDRNPYNEVECSDHYSRAMASYGTYLAACGYRYDGPAASLTFSPRIQPENFRAGFTSAEGWGQFSQQFKKENLTASLTIHYGHLTLQTLRLGTFEGFSPKLVNIEQDKQTVNGHLKIKNSEYIIKLDQPILVKDGQTLTVMLS